MKDKKIVELKNLVETAEVALQQAREILAEITGDVSFSVAADKARYLNSHEDEDGQIIEGVFDGQEMIGPDGKKYSVPVNYASKSKLVEGDMLKLTIKKDGTFLYKQIGPAERARKKGVLVYDNETDNFRVMTEDGKSYLLLTASVTYFKGDAGDQAIILVPKDDESTWAALENIIKKGSQSEEEKPDEIAEGLDDLSSAEELEEI